MNEESFGHSAQQTRQHTEATIANVNTSTPKQLPQCNMLWWQSL